LCSISVTIGDVTPVLVDAEPLAAEPAAGPLAFAAIVAPSAMTPESVPFKDGKAGLKLAANNRASLELLKPECVIFPRLQVVTVP